MSALAKSRFNVVIRNIFGGLGEAVKSFGEYINSTDIDDVTVSELVVSGEDKKVIEAIKIEEETRKKLEAKTFGNSSLIKKDKDEDGYNKIPDKLKDIKAENISARVEQTSDNERAKGGRQKTRVDED